MNTLKELLETAINDPAAAPQWYETLLQTTVFVITDGREQSTQGEAKIAFATWEKEDGTPVVPIYSSLECMRAWVKEDTPYMPLSCLDLLAIVNGSYVMLDATTEGGCEFSPDAIAALLQGAQRMNVQLQAEEAKPVDPQAVEEELATCFKKDARVKKAYLAQMKDGRLAVAISCDEYEYEEIRGKADWLIKAAIGQKTPFELVHAGSSELADHITAAVEPFYKKKWLGIF